jgi:hypothetical protein
MAKSTFENWDRIWLISTTVSKGSSSPKVRKLLNGGNNSYEKDIDNGFFPEL